MIISYVIGMSGVSWPIAGSAVGMETVGVVRLLMIRRTIYPVFGIYLIFFTRITPVVLDVPDAVEAGQELMHRERSRLDKRLLALEEEYNGRAFYAGSCILCPWEECTRRSGKACRYPLRIRRSLEACGFDLGRTTSELFGIEMKWSENRNLPEYLLLVSGFLYDWETPIW